MTRLTPAEARRAITWNLVIAEQLLGGEHVEQGHDRRWHGQGGFSVDRRDGGWFGFAAQRGGYSTGALVEFLKPDYSRDDAARWVAAFLAAHPGTGPCTHQVDDDDDATGGSGRRQARAAVARRILDTMAPVVGTPAETYLRARALPPLYPPDLVGYAEDARTGEGALVGVLTAHGRVVGVQLLYLDPEGRKSLVEPVRERFNLEPAPGAVFDIPSPNPGTLDIIADTVAAEGLEDALSVWQLRRNWRIAGLPGIGALAHLAVRRGERVVVLADGDPPDSPAAKAVAPGCDALLAADAKVQLAVAPAGQDANSILQSPGGLAALIKFIATATPAELSVDGEAARLAQLDETAYFQARREAAKKFKVPVGHLDKLVKRHKPKPAPGAAEADPGPDADDDPPWPGPVDLAAALASAAAIIPSYLAAPAHYADLIPLWAAASHLVRDDALAIPVCPQLGFVSADPDAGKSTALEIVGTLAYRGQARGSYTPSTVFRRIAEAQATFCLSELHNMRPDLNFDLKAVLNCCHRRSEAFVDRTETRADGSRFVKTYRCWAALAWAAIDSPRAPIPAELRSRAIVLPMQPALPAEAKRLTKDNSPSKNPALIDVRRQLAAWSATIRALPRVTLPDGLYNRRADNWRILFQVATLAGGDWPERVRPACAALATLEHRPSLLIRLLTGICDAFAEAAPAGFLPTGDLIERLTADDEAGWTEANRGRAITAYWLRDHLRGLLKPDGSQQENYVDPATGVRRNQRGYFAGQFDDAFLRYLPHPSASSASDPANPVDLPDFAEADGHPASASAASASASENPREAVEADGRPRSASQNSRETAPFGVGEADEADEADGGGVGGKEIENDGAKAAETEPASVPDAAEAAETLTVVPEKPGDPTPQPTPKPPNGAAPEPPDGYRLDNQSEAAHAAEPQGGTASAPPGPSERPSSRPAGSIVDTIIQDLHRANPARSVRWLSQKTGQPKSVIEAVLHGGDAP